MKGTGIGQLAVNYVTNGSMPGIPLWQYGKNVQTDWNLATLPVASPTDFKVC